MPDPVVSPSPSPSAPPSPVVSPAVASSPPTPSSPVTTPPTPTPAAVPASPPPSPPAGQRPAYVPEAYWDATAGKVKDTEFAAHFNELSARAAADEIRKTTLPPTANDYKADLPADFKPPEGVKFEFKADDPLIAQAKSMAYEMGIDQTSFSKLLGLYAGAQVASQEQIVAAKNAEIAKLGAAGPTRIDALTRFFKADMGEEAGARRMTRIFTAQDVLDAEADVSRRMRQGGGSFKGTGREAPEPQGKVTEAEYAKMSPQDRLAYARRHDQKSFLGRKAS